MTTTRTLFIGLSTVQAHASSFSHGTLEAMKTTATTEADHRDKAVRGGGGGEEGGGGRRERAQFRLEHGLNEAGIERPACADLSLWFWPACTDLT